MSGRPEASDEHVDAVARVLMRAEEAHDVWDWRTKSRAILATDDPHARAALLASFTPDEVLATLVQRGVLRAVARPGRCEHGALLTHEDCPRLTMRRLVTEWEPLTSDEAIALLRERLTSPVRADSGPQSDADGQEAHGDVTGAHDGTEGRA